MGVRQGGFRKPLEWGARKGRGAGACCAGGKGPAALDSRGGGGVGRAKPVLGGGGATFSWWANFHQGEKPRKEPFPGVVQPGRRLRGMIMAGQRGYAGAINRRATQE